MAYFNSPRGSLDLEPRYEIDLGDIRPLQHQIDELQHENDELRQHHLNDELRQHQLIDELHHHHQHHHHQHHASSIREVDEIEPSSPSDLDDDEKKLHEARIVQHQQSQETMSTTDASTTYKNKKGTAISRIDSLNSSLHDSGDSCGSNSNDDDSNNEKDWDDFSDIDEKKLIRKLDWRLVPLFTLLYLIAFLDRGNIDEAKSEGMTGDLKMTDKEYNFCLTIFFICYAVAQIPSTYLMRRVRPSRFIVGTMIVWSIVMTLMGTIKSYKQLLATRALLGIFQAPLFIGISYCLSMYYNKNEFLIRESIFFSAASIAGAFSGLLAIGLNNLDGAGGISGWRYLFIIEGVCSVLVGVLAYKFFPDFPDTASWLTKRERLFVAYRVAHDNNHDGCNIFDSKREFHPERSLMRPAPEFGEDDSLNDNYIFAVLKDWQCWCQLLLFIGVCVPLSGVSLFTPAVINRLGFTSAMSHLLSIPIYIVAKVGSVVQAFTSSYLGVRSPFLLINFASMLIGYIICITGDPVTNPGVVYAGAFVIALGIYPAFPMVVVWNSNNLSGSYKRCLGMGFQIALGNFSGTFSSNFYRAQDSPHFKLGHSVEIGFIMLGVASLAVLFVGYTAANLDKKRKLASGFYDSYSDEQLRQMGDKSPYFSYRL